jgi:hypothetical protein
MMHALLSSFGFIVGGLIGAAFGAIQNAAALRHEKREAAGGLKSGWVLIPGSMRRVAFLMVALVLVQIGLPMLFDGMSQWMVSGGVILGYGLMLSLQLRRKISVRYGSE